MGESDDMPKVDLYSEDIAHYYDEVLNMDMSESSKAYFSTLKRDARPTRPAKTFTGRMAFYFVMTAVMCVAIFTVVLATVWEQQFQGYARDNMQRLAQQTADALSSQYEESGGWTPDVVGYAPAITAAYPDLRTTSIPSCRPTFWTGRASNSARSGSGPLTPRPSPLSRTPRSK